MSERGYSRLCFFSFPLSLSGLEINRQGQRGRGEDLAIARVCLGGGGGAARGEKRRGEKRREEMWLLVEEKQEIDR